MNRFERARLHSLRKNSDEHRFWEGHGFRSALVTAAESIAASSRWGTRILGIPAPVRNSSEFPLGKKDGPYHQANGGTSQEGTIQKIANFTNNVK